MASLIRYSTKALRFSCREKGRKLTHTRAKINEQHQMEAYQGVSSRNSTYRTSCPSSVVFKLASQYSTTPSGSHIICFWGVRVPSETLTSSNARRLAESHPTSHHPPRSLMGLSNSSLTWSLTNNTSRIGFVVHDRTNLSDRMSACSTSAAD